MTWRSRLRILAALGVAVILVVESKKRPGVSGTGGVAFPAGMQASATPRLINLGAGHCVPCKMMKPVLAGLQAEFSGRFETRYIDLTEDGEAPRAYGVRVIPTQIFLDADGNELFRHEGYFSTEDILAKWQELGIDLSNE